MKSTANSYRKKMNQEIEVKNLDHLGIVAGIVDELGIVDLRYLDYYIRHPDNGTLSENGVAEARRSGNGHSTNGVKQHQKIEGKHLT